MYKVYPDAYQYRTQVADVIKYAGKPISAIEICDKLGLKKTDGWPFRGYPVTLAISYMKQRKWLDAIGQNKGTKYSFNVTYNDELNPLKQSSNIATTPSALTPKAALVPVVTVEVPKCALKLLVKYALEHISDVSTEVHRATLLLTSKIL